MFACCRRDSTSGCGRGGGVGCCQRNRPHRDHEPVAGPGAISAVSGEQMPYDDDEEIISRTITVAEHAAQEIELEPRNVNSRTPLKTNYNYPYMSADGECADWLPDFETFFEKSFKIIMLARSPKILCLAGTGFIMVALCTFSLISTLAAPPPTSTTTTTTCTYTITHTGTTVTTTGVVFLPTTLRAVCGMDHFPNDQIPAVCLDLVVEGVDVEDFAQHPEQRSTFEAGIANAIAAQGGHGILPSDVHLKLTKGSSLNHIIVKVAVTSLLGDSVSSIHDALRSSGTELTEKVATSVEGVTAVDVYSSEVVETGSPQAREDRAYPFQEATPLWTQLAMCGGGGLVGVLCLGIICACCLRGRSRDDDEDFGSQRNFQRREAEGDGLEQGAFDGQIDDNDMDLQEPGQRWSPMEPGTPQEVPVPGREPAGAHPEQVSPRLKEVQFQQRRAEFEFMHTIRDMGFTEIEARAVLQEVDGDHETALSRLTAMLDNKNI